MEIEEVTPTELSDETRRARARQLAQQAIAVAIQGRWDEAIELNAQIVELRSNDAEAFNRLGKAYTETGRITEAREAYESSLRVDPANLIAQRNIERLSQMTDAEAAELARKSGQKLEPSFFMEETGKTAVVTLQHPAAPAVLATLTAGDQVKLERQENAVTLVTMEGTYVGRIEDQLATRLARLTLSGNEYKGGIVGVDGNTVRVILRETLQAPENVGRISFPSRVTQDTLPRPYLREGLLRRSGDEEDEDELDVDLTDSDDVDDDDDPNEFGFHEGTLDEA